MNQETLKKGNFIEIGEALRDARKLAEHKKQGFGSFNDYVESLGMASSTATKYIKTYDVFVDFLSIDDDTLFEIGLDRLCIIRKACETKAQETCEDLIAKAKEMSPRELKIYVKLMEEDKPVDPYDEYKKEFVKVVKQRVGALVTPKNKEFCMALIVDRINGQELIDKFNSLYSDFFKQDMFGDKPETTADFFKKEAKNDSSQINDKKSERSPF